MLDGQFVPPRADEDGTHPDAPRFDRNGHVGHQVTQVVLGEAARLAHAHKQQVVHLDFAASRPALQVEGKELAQARADHSQVHRPRQPGVELPIERLGRTGKGQPLVAGDDGDRHFDVGNAAPDDVDARHKIRGRADAGLSFLRSHRVGAGRSGGGRGRLRQGSFLPSASVSVRSGLRRGRRRGGLGGWRWLRLGGRFVHDRSGSALALVVCFFAMIVSPRGL